MHINGYWNTRNWYFLRHFYCGSLFFKIEFFTYQWRIPKWEGYNSVLFLVSCSGRIVMKKRASANMSAPVRLLISRDNIVWKNIFYPFYPKPCKQDPRPGENRCVLIHRKQVMWDPISHMGWNLYYSLFNPIWPGLYFFLYFSKIYKKKSAL